MSNSLGRVGLETAGNTIVAAVTGGNIGAAAAGTAAGDLAAIGSREWAQSVAGSLTSDAKAQQAIANVLSNAIASGAGAAAGAVSGHGNSSLNALNGAGYASAVQQFNQAAEENREVLSEARDENGKPLTGQEELQIAEYYNARRDLAKIDPDNAALGQSFLTEPGRTAVPTEADIETMSSALSEAQEVDRLLTTPEGQKELLEKAPVGTENLREAAKEIAKSENGRKSGVPALDFIPKQTIARPYKRPSNAGPTRAQKESVQNQPCVDCGTVSSRQVADHIDPLVVEYYRTGENDINKQTQINAVQPHCPNCSSVQGGQLSNFSRAMKQILGIK